MDYLYEMGHEMDIRPVWIAKKRWTLAEPNTVFKRVP